MRRIVLGVSIGLLSVGCATMQPSPEVPHTVESPEVEMIEVPVASEVPPPPVAPQQVAAPVVESPPVLLPQEPVVPNKAAKPEDVILKATKQAILEPTADGYRVGTHLYTYIDSALYKLYAMPLRFSHIRLQPGEALSGDAVIGDPHRWKLVESQSGSGETASVLIMVMPLLDDLSTTLTIATDRHLYVFEAVASKRAYMAYVGFLYPAEDAERVAKAKRQQQQAAPALGVDPLALNSGYIIRPKDEKNPPPWTPARVFSDTAKLYVEFPRTVHTSELPALFVPVGKHLEVINYRTVTGKHGQLFMVVDGQPELVELRLVKHQQVSSVRITKGVR